jgi:hypothetical protein
MQHNQLRSSTIRFVDLMIQETGTYNPMLMRPYETRLNGQVVDTIVDRYERSSERQLNGVMLAGVARDVLSPSLVAKADIPIHMGWNERRLRFILQMEEISNSGNATLYVFQGYTNTLGVSYGGAVDPNMEFVINSFVAIRRTQVATTYGIQNIDSVIESAQVIDGRLTSSFQQDISLLRPMDVFSGFSAQALKEIYTGGGQNPNIRYNDSRVKMTSESTRSNRKNGMPTDYLQKVLNAHQSGQDLSDFGIGGEDILVNASSLVYEDPVSRNPLMRQLASIRGIPGTSVFTLSNLMQIDREVGSKVRYAKLGNDIQLVHSTGQTAYWNDASEKTMVATTLANAVPGLMMDALVEEMIITCTNHDSQGIMSTTLQPIRTIVNVDPSRGLGVMRTRMEREVMFDLTYGNNKLFWFQMHVSIYGETRIKLIWDGEPMFEYAVPSFCDSLMAPVISTDARSYNGIIEGFQQLTNSLTEARIPQATPNFGI